MARCFLTMALVGFLLSTGALADCAGARLSFTEQVSEQVAEDELVVRLGVQKQAATVEALNARLNEAAQAVGRIARTLTPPLRLETDGWRSWPVHDKSGTRVVGWRGALSYRLVGPLGARTLAALRRLQGVAHVVSLTPRVSATVRDQVRDRLEKRLLRQARARLAAVVESLAYGKGRFESITLDARHQGVGPRPMMAKAMRVMDLPAPAVEGGQQRIQVSGRFVACLLPRSVR